MNRPLFAGDPEVRILGYGKEELWKAISGRAACACCAVVLDHESEYRSRSAAISSVSQKVGCSRDSLRITDLDAQVEKLLDRIVESDVPRVTQAYEKRIAGMENDKLILAEKLAYGTGPKHTFEQMFELTLSFLSNPWKLWENGDLTLRRTVLKLAFPEPIKHCRETGCLNYKNAFVFKAMKGFCVQENGMVL